jgi:IS30 family transposase
VAEQGNSWTEGLESALACTHETLRMYGNLANALHKDESALGKAVVEHERAQIGRLKGHGAEAFRDALTKRINTLPAQLRRSITHDQGPEMSEHVRFSVETGVEVYFCDLKSPWQRGTNENTNGLLRQYLPKRTDLSIYNQRQLDAIAKSLNTRPRKTLGFMTPCGAFAEAVAATA